MPSTSAVERRARLGLVDALGLQPGLQLRAKTREVLRTVGTIMQVDGHNGETWTALGRPKALLKQDALDSPASALSQGPGHPGPILAIR